ncbi:MAG: helix-turn-helix transcriptional regulator [Asgard group archaeon]|nr:helix-turn-helix transcriptional regulator [Asgard group archaeon]
MTYDPEKIWKEMYELIPQMREAVRKGLERDFETIEHNDSHIQKELLLLNNALNLLQKKWTMDLIYIIRIKGTPSFNDIRRVLPELNSRTLSDRLKEFEENHIATRTVLNTQPIRVSYTLTNLGNGIYELLIPLLLFFVGEKNKIDLDLKL